MLTGSFFFFSPNKLKCSKEYLRSLYLSSAGFRGCCSLNCRTSESKSSSVVGRYTATVCLLISWDSCSPCLLFLCVDSPEPIFLSLIFVPSLSFLFPDEKTVERLCLSNPVLSFLCLCFTAEWVGLCTILYAVED